MIYSKVYAVEKALYSTEEGYELSPYVFIYGLITGDDFSMGLRATGPGQAKSGEIQRPLWEMQRGWHLSSLRYVNEI
jgi:hypothetical protein